MSFITTSYLNPNFSIDLLVSAKHASLAFYGNLQYLSHFKKRVTCPTYNVPTENASGTEITSETCSMGLKRVFEKRFTFFPARF